MAQSPWVAVDHLLQIGAAILNREQFVDLFLVFDHREASLGVVEHEVHLLGDRILYSGTGTPPIDCTAAIAQ